MKPLSVLLAILWFPIRFLVALSCCFCQWEWSWRTTSTIFAGIYDLVELTLGAAYDVMDCLVTIFMLLFITAPTKRKKVVVVGGGFAGAVVAKSLQTDFEVTLIDKKMYWEYTPGIVRALVHPVLATRWQFQHRSYLPLSQVITDVATKLTSKTVITRNWGEYPFDYLVIATGGSPRNFGLIPCVRGSTLAATNPKLELADKVLVVGGGIVGIEIAAEIASEYPEKQITLIHSHDRLMNGMPGGASEYAYDHLTNRNVSILFGQKVTRALDGGKYLLSSGKEIRADLAFLCTGTVPQGSLFAAEESQRPNLDERGYIIPNEFLQTADRPNVFVCGDVTAASLKLAQSAELQGKTVVKNIRALERGTKLYPYVEKPRLIFISLGPWDGFAVWGDNVFCGGLWRPFAVLMKFLIEVKCLSTYWLNWCFAGFIRTEKAAELSI